MNKNLKVEKRVHFDVGVSQVWEAMTNPELIKQYFFGTQVSCDWKVGSEILFEGSYEGKSYRDKGEIQEIEEGKVLRYSYWSGFSGLEDKEENYSMVTYRLSGDENSADLVLTQEGFANEQAQAHSESGWDAVLGQMKALVESQ